MIDRAVYSCSCRDTGLVWIEPGDTFTTDAGHKSKRGGYRRCPRCLPIPRPEERKRRDFA